MPDKIFITYPELPDFGVPKYSRKHLLDMQRRGQFPRAVQLSPNRVAWELAKVQEWCASRPVAFAVAAGASDAAVTSRFGFVRQSPLPAASRKG